MRRAMICERVERHIGRRAIGEVGARTEPGRAGGRQASAIGV